MLPSPRVRDGRAGSISGSNKLLQILVATLTVALAFLWFGGNRGGAGVAVADSHSLMFALIARSEEQSKLIVELTKQIELLSSTVTRSSATGGAVDGDGGQHQQRALQGLQEAVEKVAGDVGQLVSAGSVKTAAAVVPSAPLPAAKCECPAVTTATSPACPSPPTCPSATQQTSTAPSSNTGRLGSAPWAQRLLAHGAVSQGTSEDSRCSFTKYSVVGSEIDGVGTPLGHLQRLQIQRGEGGATSFWYAVEDTLHSAEYIGLHEKLNTKYWIGALRAAPSNETCYVLDVGSNGGFFSLLSRSLGCNVLAVDAQPRCLERLQSSAAVSGFSTGLEVRWSAVSATPGMTMQIGATKCSGLWSTDPALHWINEESEYSVEVTGASVTDLVQGWLPPGGVIRMMKVDIEGSEVNAWATTLPLMRERRVQAILAEVVPARVDAITPYPEVKATLTSMYEYGYACGTLDAGGIVAHLSLQRVLETFDPDNKRLRGGLSVDWVCSLVDASGS